MRHDLTAPVGDPLTFRIDGEPITALQIVLGADHALVRTIIVT